MDRDLSEGKLSEMGLEIWGAQAGNTKRFRVNEFAVLWEQHGSPAGCCEFDLPHQSRV